MDSGIEILNEITETEQSISLLEEYNNRLAISLILQSAVILEK
jgi:hypothetical protein